ncbi:hypothetical protein BDK51DRAFT_27081 [Blyttiomyces helicus]|uniref:Uncharacterized protein n=1 Tax=Blyttiomyces helicus TaxID=388810 RepID=A0A4P9WNS7_9FUNG|nr:hypothetical protein BDK51DRAFT_27081 [Blyttiomyces helicus]|eukprot:RKO94789.1 hypothetical protein BDK51DRAFT_27081 [Blyttiomyces helicus]
MTSEPVTAYLNEIRGQQIAHRGVVRTLSNMKAKQSQQVLVAKCPVVSRDANQPAHIGKVNRLMCVDGLNPLVRVVNVRLELLCGGNELFQKTMEVVFQHGVWVYLAVILLDPVCRETNAAKEEEFFSWFKDREED